MQVSVIIVNYNVANFLEQCLLSLERSLTDDRFEIIVIDNASTDGSLDLLAKQFPEVKVISNSANVGFAHANNQALSIVKSEIVLFLNPDTLLPESLLQKTTEQFATDPQIGAIGVRMIDGNGHFLPESKRRTPTAWSSFIKLFGVDGIGSNKQHGYYDLHLAQDNDGETEVLSGACLFARRSVLQSIGGFDERFFMYAEDIDLSMSIRRKGLKIWYAGSSCIIHFKGESTTKNVRYVHDFYTAMLLFVRKHYPGLPGMIMRSFLSMGIYVKSILARLAITETHSMKMDETAGTFFVVAADGEASSALAILQAHGITASATTSQDISAIVGKAKEPNLVFVAGTQPYEEIIAICIAFAGRATFWFHEKKSDSIVMSDNRNSAGRVLKKKRA